MLSNLPDGTVVSVHLDKADPQFIFIEVLCGSKADGGCTDRGGEQGWVAKEALLLSTSLTASFAYEETGPDECSFGEGETVYGFQEVTAN